MVRLLTSVFLCIYGGSVLGSAIHYLRFHSFHAWFAALAAAALVLLGATLVLVNRPWRLETFMRRLVLTAVCFYAGFFLGAWAQKLAGPQQPSVIQMAIGGLSFQGAVLVLVSRMLRRHQVSWAEAFGWNERRWRAVLIGVIAACFFLPVGWGLQWGSAEILQRLPWGNVQPEEQQTVQTLRLAGSVGQGIVLGIVTIVLAPFAEEFLFRGILYVWIKQAGYPRLALWATSLVFAAMHQNLVTFIPLALLAIILVQLYERTGNLLASIAGHSLFNALNFTLLYLQKLLSGS